MEVEATPEPFGGREGGPQRKRVGGLCLCPTSALPHDPPLCLHPLAQGPRSSLEPAKSAPRILQ